jgi:lipopolysaccharide transport system ATP-binding protein
VSDEVLIKVEGVRKKFCRSLKKSLWYGVKDMATEVAGGKGRHGALRDGEFWAVNDVSFELRRGECLGLIGRNGAGKTTLLKMLNGLIKPDEGRIEIRGRVGALIALGAGFNPILTGRENIYVNGSVLGLTKKEIDAKIDEIIDFADIPEFIDAPVQSYSSGMQVRLGFAVATALEPDVLLLDEVLAVGDAGFRAKCYSRMAALRARAAVIFVSHSMPQLARICNTSILLAQGTTCFYGATALAITKYDAQFKHDSSTVRAGNGRVRVSSIQFRDSTRRVCDHLRYGESVIVEITVLAEVFIPSLVVDITFRTLAQEVAAECNNYVLSAPMSVRPGERCLVSATIPKLCLNPSTYSVSAFLLDANMIAHYDWFENASIITTVGGRPATAPYQIHAEWSLAVAETF